MATGSVQITAGSGTGIRVLTNAGVDSGAAQQIMSLAGPDGVLAPFDPDGTLQVSPEPTALFVDDFSGTLTTNFTTGGTAPTVASGMLTFSTSTTAGTASYVRTIGTFLLRSGSYLLSATLVRLEASAITNLTRWWGLGLYGTVSAGAPIANGAIFQLDSSTGLLYAATFSAGSRTNYIALTRPTDAAFHRYEIRYRQSVIFWVIDGVTVARVDHPNLAQAQSMAAVAGSMVAQSAAGAAGTAQISSIGVSDLSGTNRSISDGTNPWIQAAVKLGTATQASGDTALVVAQHPSSVLFPGTAASNLGKQRSNTLSSTDVGVGMVAVRAYTTPTTMATGAGGYGQLIEDTEGKLIISGTGAPDLTWNAAISVSSTSQTLLKAAAGTGVRNYITDLVITSIVTTVTQVQIQDGSTAMGVYAVSSAAPLTISLGTPLRGTAATAVNVALSAANTVIVSATGYTGI